MDLERELDPDAFRRRAQAELAALDSDISEAPRGSNTYDRLVERRDELRAQMQGLPAPGQGVSLSEVQYQAQATTLSSRIEALQAQRDDVVEEVADLETRISRIPAVESQLYQLEQERKQLEDDLTRLRSNRSSAERSESLEEQSKGEQLITIEQPVRPREPIAPDKPQLAALAIIGSALVGALIALWPEVARPKVHRSAHVSELIPGIRVIEVPRFGVRRMTRAKIAQYAVIGMVSLVLGGWLTVAAYQTLV
jgi:uncharacterized protein involved in exopolysaccharide biosynthesis